MDLNKDIPMITEWTQSPTINENFHELHLYAVTEKLDYIFRLFMYMFKFPVIKTN